MRLLTVNTGSASVKLAIYEAQGSELHRLRYEHYRSRDDDPEVLLGDLLSKTSQREIDAVCHRVVHGGDKLDTPCVLNADIEAHIEQLAELAPLHNPVALRWIRAARQVFGAQLPQVAVFDTSFYASLPGPARIYALPQGLAQEHGIRRYGFHGLAHQGMWERWCQLHSDLPSGGRLISLQLGGGCSMTAVNEGTPCDTSMGFSPAEGLVMASRCGDIDPTVVTHLMRKTSMSPEDIDHVLSEQSGLGGVSGKDPDMQTLVNDPDPHSRAAVELYCYRARKYIGAYLAAMGGAEGIVFGGGVGENLPEVRERILTGMQWCGITLDLPANLATIGAEGRISTPSSDIEIWVSPVNEADILAREAHKVLMRNRAKNGNNS